MKGQLFALQLRGILPDGAREQKLVGGKHGLLFLLRAGEGERTKRAGRQTARQESMQGGHAGVWSRDSFPKIASKCESVGIIGA